MVYELIVMAALVGPGSPALPEEDWAGRFVYQASYEAPQFAAKDNCLKAAEIVRQSSGEDPRVLAFCKPVRGSVDD